MFSLSSDNVVIWIFEVYVLVTNFLLISWGGVRLSPLGTSVTNWPIVPALDDR
jgi:hypothetical protein